MNVRRERGSVALTIGLSLPVLIGMVALGTEITFLLYKQRQMQSAADAAALGEATARQSGHPAPGVEARGIAGYLGFIDGTGSATVTVNNPPLAGPQKGNAGAVEVIVAQQQTLSLAKLFYSGVFAVSARAVAVVGSGGYCVLQLGNEGTFQIGNGATANLLHCGLAVNGGGSPALSVYGGANLTAKSVSVVGTSLINNGGSVNPLGGLKTGQSAVADPYAGVNIPAYSGCGGGNGSSTEQFYGWKATPWQFYPGVYCGGLSVSGGGSANLNPGVYIINRGEFSFKGNQLTGIGVTIVLTSSTGRNYATAVISNGATATLSAPTSGNTAGMIFYGDRRAPTGTTSQFAGGTALNFTGAIYLPTETLTWDNGSGNNGSTCTELIVGSITMQGGATFQVNCPAGVREIGGGGAASLVE